MKLWNSRFLKCPQAPAESPSLGIADHSQKGTCESKGRGCLLENRKICSLPSTALGLPAGSDSRESPCSSGDLGSISGLERSPGEGNECLPTPVFLPGKSHGQRRLVGLQSMGLQRVGHDLGTKQQTPSQGHPTHLKQAFLTIQPSLLPWHRYYSCYCDI